MRAKQLFLISLFLFLSFNLNNLLLSNVLAEDEPSSFKKNAQVELRIVTDRESFQVGSSPSSPIGLIGIEFKIKPDWHIYWKNSGESAFPTKINYNIPENWELGYLNWAVPEKYIEKGGIKTFGYENKTLLFNQVYADLSDLGEEESIEVTAEIRYLVCKDICVPGSANLKKTITVSKVKPLIPSKDSSLFEETKEKLPLRKPETINFSFDKSFYLPGETANLLIDLEASAQNTASDSAINDSVSNASISKNAQIFPFDSKILSGINGFALKSSSKLVFPVTVAKDAPAGQASISGTILLSDELANQLSLPRYFNWQTPLQIKKESLNKALKNESFPRDDEIESAPLSYKTVDKEAAADAKELKEAESAGDSLVSNGAANTVASKTRELESGSVFYYMLLAFLGGILLNLMPCVLPVLSIKVFSLVEHQGMSKKERMKSAFFVTLGILSSFLTLAASVIFIRSLGTHVGWGFQFQSPIFLIFLIITVFLFALSFLGFYDINLKFPSFKKVQNPNLNDQDEEKTNPLEDFLDGVLVTTLSTPCTAPFLGTALAFAFLAPSYVIVLIFTLIGLGLSLPYTLLSLNSSVHKYFPEPGAWMNSFKQFMGFLLLGTVVWLLSVYQFLTATGLIKALWILFFLGFAFWLQKQSFIKGRLKKIWPLAAFIILLSLLYSFRQDLFTYNLASTSLSANSSSKIDWEPYSKSLLAKARESKEAVFIDFTAEWCITCKANEKLIIYTEDVISALKEYKIKPVIADWTTGDENVSMALEEYGGSGVPHYVVLDKNGEVSEILSSILTKESLISAFKKAGS